VNHNQSSRPFLRLFSALQSTEATGQAVDKTAQTAPANGMMPGKPNDRCESSASVAGQLHATTCDQHHDTKSHGKPLQPEEKIIAGSVGPRTENRRPLGPRSVDCSTEKPRRVEVSLADIAPVLADAINHQRGWLSDFSDDTVTIDADLYEVLLAYQQMRRLNAA
jgi:hypothetical protein